MTMFPAAPAQNLFSSSSSSTHTLNIISSYDEDQDGNVKFSGSDPKKDGLKGYETQNYWCSLLGSDHHHLQLLQQQQEVEEEVNQMGDEEDHESRLTETSSSNINANYNINNVGGNANYQGGGGGSTSKDNKEEEGDEEEEEEEDEGGWLQLSIGGHRRHANTTTTTTTHPKHQTPAAAAAIVNNNNNNNNKLIELDLLPPCYSPPAQQQQKMMMSAVRSFAPIFHHHHHHHQTNKYTTLPNLLQFQHYPQLQFHGHQHNTTTSSTSSNNYWRPPPTTSPGYFFPRPPQHSSTTTGVDDSGPSLDFRVIDPPRRPHSGVWFMLQASQFQAKEPFLPQIPKSYLRIRDGRMTVGLVMKYLVDKLRLDSESEIEIRCRGQQLLPLLTLQHVRDNVWSNSSRVEGGTFISPAVSSPSSTTTHHLMLLHYGRSSS